MTAFSATLRQAQYEWKISFARNLLLEFIINSPMQEKLSYSLHRHIQMPMTKPILK